MLGRLGLTQPQKLAHEGTTNEQDKLGKREQDDNKSQVEEISGILHNLAMEALFCTKFSYEG